MPVARQGTPCHPVLSYCDVAGIVWNYLGSFSGATRSKCFISTILFKHLSQGLGGKHSINKSLSQKEQMPCGSLCSIEIVFLSSGRLFPCRRLKRVLATHAADMRLLALKGARRETNFRRFATFSHYVAFTPFIVFLKTLA